MDLGGGKGGIDKWLEGMKERLRKKERERSERERRKKGRK